jgi:hypothetical protein
MSNITEACASAFVVTLIAPGVDQRYADQIQKKLGIVIHPAHVPSRGATR